MNYFSHGIHYLDRPYFLAGTAVPDWLSAIDRRVRMRPRRVEPFAAGSGSPLAELAAGVMQHLHDDGWFHRSRPFADVTETLTQLFREGLPGDEEFRASFLGHIVMELQLDGVLALRHPEKLEAYYAALAVIDPEIVQSGVNGMAKESTTDLARFIPLFRNEQFLWDYSEPAKLLRRLNQVMFRIKLKPLPLETQTVLAKAWKVVESRADELLTGSVAAPLGQSETCGEIFR